MPEKAFEQYGFAGGIAVMLLIAAGFVTKWLLAKLDQKDNVIQALYSQSIEMNKQMMEIISLNTNSNITLVAELKVNTQSTHELSRQIQALARVQSDLINRNL